VFINDLEVVLGEKVKVLETQEVRRSQVRILVVDDFDLWHRFVTDSIEGQPDLQIIGVASDGLEGVQKAEELKPDIILLYIGIPKLDGIEAARQIRNLAPRSKILFSSATSDQCAVRAAFSVGGWGYLVKSDAATDLLPGIEAVALGKQFVSSSLMACSDVSEII
jgi:DNA-binding NarL/FixJ family response regulator